MSAALIESPSWPAHPEPTWRDPVLVVVLTSLSIVVAAHFELNEALYALTRRAEFLQLDEWPVGMVVLLLGFIWLSWKRHRHVQHELRARRLAETALTNLVAENRRLAEENLRIQEIERKHLARELHDELGQYLNAIKLDAVLMLDEGPEIALAAHAGAIVRAVDHLHGAVSRMIGRLRPVALDELGLTAAIEHCLDHWRERLPAVEFELSTSGALENLGETLNLTLYRLIQEGLTNIHKHAHARHVRVDIARRGADSGGPGILRLTLSDDGCGMQPDQPTARFGLKGMRERVAISNGTFSLDSAPGRGVRWQASFPVEHEP